jgi:hypothetical protein
MIAPAVYLLMLFILLPIRRLRYLLPFCLIVGWSAVPQAACARRGARGPVCTPCCPRSASSTSLAKVAPPVAALEWVKTNRPDTILFSDSLLRHADVYRREGETRSEPKSEADCEQFRNVVKRVLSTSHKLCGTSATQVASFKRDARIHDKHHLEFNF